MEWHCLKSAKSPSEGGQINLKFISLMISMKFDLHKKRQLERKYFSGSIPLLTPTTWSMPLLTTNHMEQAPAYHQQHGACPCLPPTTWSMPLLTTNHMEQAPAYHQPHGACPCLPPITWNMPLLTTNHMEHAPAYPQRLNCILDHCTYVHGLTLLLLC